MYTCGPKQLSPPISPSKSSRSSKLEALDNLVISTIFNVSSKLCGTSLSALKNAAAAIPDQNEEEVQNKYFQEQLGIFLFSQASRIETVLYLLEDVDMPTTPAKKTSRELSGSHAYQLTK